MIIRIQRLVALVACRTLLAIVFFASFAAHGQFAKPEPYAYSIIVKYSDDTQARAASSLPVAALASGDQTALAQAISLQTGLNFRHHLPVATGAQVYNLDEWRLETELDAIAEALSRDPAIVYAETNRMVQAMLSPPDPFYSLQWHYFETLGGLNLPTAWNSVTGSGVNVAVLDSGSLFHPDLAVRFLGGYDMVSADQGGTFFSANDGDGRDDDARDPGNWRAAGQCGPMSTGRDSSWHGLHVAGTVGASAFGGGVVGVAFDATIVPVRVLGRCGGTEADVTDGIMWAAGLPVANTIPNFNRARVINMSLGSGPGATCSQTQIDAIAAARDQGAIVIVSAGNRSADADTFTYTNCPGTFSVAATSRAGGRASYSNFGSMVDIAAPGGETDVIPADGVYSTLNAGTTVPAGFSWDFYQGTSMAAPHVAGLAALMLEGAPNMTVEQMEFILTSTARPFPTTCAQCGSGIADATAAIAALPPHNDNFPFAAGASVTTNNFQGTLSNAFNDGGTNGVGATQPDVWYQFFSPSVGGTLRIDTCGSHALTGLDTVLSVHSYVHGETGTADNQLALNDNFSDAGGDPGAACPSGTDSAVVLTTLPGQSFLVRVARASGATDGDFLLSFSFDAMTPVSDSFANALPISEGSFTDSLIGATVDGSTSVGVPQPDVWYAYVAPATGVLRVNTCGTMALEGLDSVLSVHANLGVAGTAANELAYNDDFQSAGGDASANCPSARDSAIALVVTDGDVLLIRVSRFSPASDGAYNLNVAFEPIPPPTNDVYSAAPTIATGLTQGTLDGASSDGSASFGIPGQPDVWFRYTAPAIGTVRIDTCGSFNLSFIDTVLSVHPDTGDVGTALNELAANNSWEFSGDPTANCPTATDSALALAVTAGQALLIRVSKFDLDDIAGAFNLNITFEFPPPINDSFFNATEIGVGSLTDSLRGATNDGSNTVGDPTQPDMWYLYTPPGPGTLRVNTCGSQSLGGVNTTLSVHLAAGGAGTTANQLAVNDDWNGAGGDPGANCVDTADSALSFDMTVVAQTVLIRVARSQAPSESFALNLSFDQLPTPSNDLFTNAQTVGSGQVVGTLVGATNDGSGSAGAPEQPDVWYAYSATEAGIFNADTCGSEALAGLDTVLTVHSNDGNAGTIVNELTFNDDTTMCSPVNGDAGIALPLDAGEDVLIRISRSAATTIGDFVLNLSLTPTPPMANDDFANATLIGPGSVQGTFVGATKDGSSSADSFNFPNEPDVWYRYAVPGAGKLRVDTCGSEFFGDVFTVLSIHPVTGGPGTVANELAANEDWQDASGDFGANCSGFDDSSLELTFFGAQDVLIRISREDEFGDEFLLNLSFEPAEVDTDGDGVPQSTDNCLDAPNANQRDTDSDGFGNVCDADLNNDCVVNVVDLGLLRQRFFSAGPDADFNGDGVVNVQDLGVMRLGFFSAPGPSAGPTICDF